MCRLVVAHRQRNDDNHAGVILNLKSIHEIERFAIVLLCFTLRHGDLCFGVTPVLDVVNEISHGLCGYLSF